MADKTITGIVTWLKGWFYDKTEITGFLNNKANQSDLNTTNGNLATLSSTVENKVDKVNGKGLSSNDYTTAEKDKLSGIEAEANKTVVDSALSSTSENPIQNKIINAALEGKAPTSHNQASTTITESSALSNIGTSANANQHTINGAIDTALGNLSSIKAIEVVTTLPTASSSTLGKLYIINENSKVNVYYTEQSGTGSSATYSWHKMDTDILDELSVDWADITNKPSSFTPSSHAHGQITNDGALTSSAVTVASGDYILITDASNSNYIRRVSNLFTSHILDTSAHSNIGSSNHATQANINTAIDSTIGTINTTLTSKGALTDDIDWSYNSNDFVNGIKLVPKTSDDTGAITFHLKS